MRKLWDGVMMVLGASVWIFGAWWLFFSESTPDVKPLTPPETLEESRQSTARAICDQLIRKNLNDPSAAQTGPLSDGFYGRWPAANVSGDRVRVTARFRAKNAFGATILARFKCVLRFDGEDVVGVDSLVEE